MLKFEQTLSALSRSEAIETIYLVIHELNPVLPSPLNVALKSPTFRNPALSVRAQMRARKAARQIIRDIESQKGKKLSALTSKQRSATSSKLYKYLRNYTTHNNDIKLRAQAALKDLSALSI